ncbi:hypothetical protein NVV95_00565 [Herbiconiux sp. CPCC 205716]|uniref:Uncharacterized protein n=1 Tax=Herbiconiux gentiana TaxID=2970912 RepID=A0ABT2GA18_9MICO|nr:hypothetical protein [Herbiconiux gentiana]MCS5713036.1 hypothetical protein [Herbiconiux gentiana]
MRHELLVEADAIVGALSPARREAVRELVINVTRRGVLDDRARSFLDRASGTTLLGEVLAQALIETVGRSAALEGPATVGRPAIEGLA